MESSSKKVVAPIRLQAANQAQFKSIERFARRKNPVPRRIT
jgi:hypothetical protein